MGAHAILSPSGASRWLSCTPSARLEQTFPDNAGDAAKEGTLAHSLAELMISKKLGRISVFKYKLELKKIEAETFYSPAMLEYIDMYSTYVIEQFQNTCGHTSDAQIFLEQKLNLTDYVPEGFGTGDVVIVGNKTLDIIDLKFGKGVAVSAMNNKQMMLYALGALREMDFLFDIWTVRMTIYQPRLDNISVWEISVAELTEWANSELKPKAQLAFDGAGDYAPGEHCRFCRAKAVCKALADKNLEIAQYDFADAALLTPAQIADILARADVFKNWLTAVQDHALTEAREKQVKYPGFKLVEGRSNRQYADAEKVEKKLLDNGFADKDIFAPKKLLGITDMEKLVGKKNFTALLSDLLIKPPGSPTLVPESDKRPEYSSVESASNDFNENF